MYQSVYFFSKKNTVRKQTLKTNGSAFNISDAFLTAYKH